MYRFSSLKRSPFKRKLGSSFKTKGGTLKRTVLRKLGKSPVAVQKRRIQALLRDIVTLRDGPCILRPYRHCNDPVTQCDHLVTRANSATYGDPRLCVALCRSCHGGYKQYRKEAYDALIRSILPPGRTKLWDMAVADMHKPFKADWTAIELVLERELTALQKKV